MAQVCVAPDSTGSNSEVVSYPCMVNTLGLPTIFFTHSAADLQWPELACLICLEGPDAAASRVKAVNENPAIADWLFFYRVLKFVEAFYIGVLKATDY